MKTLLSLFDYSGAWSKPFADAGWDVIQIDIKFGSIHDIKTWDSVEYIFDELGITECNGIICALPCTDFAASGARHWKSKEKVPPQLDLFRDPQSATEASIELTNQVLRIIDLFEPTDPTWVEESKSPWFWAIENPVGRLSTLFPELGKPMYWQPYEFAGYVTSVAEAAQLEAIRAKDGVNVTAAERDLIWSTNAYTKKTGIWGRFNRPALRPIPAVKANQFGSPVMSLGGKGGKTKEVRSNTPAGFAQAFFEANCNYNSLLPENYDSSIQVGYQPY